ncbi:MAG: hypothetical protein AAFR66_17875 [Bacteroidota bacterium]
MRKISNTLFLLVGVIFPILIGGLHTLTHFQALTSTLVQEKLGETFILFDKEESLYLTWGIMSFMMGVAFVIIGLLNAETFRRILQQKASPLIPMIIMSLYLACVIYAGYTFQQMPQFIGGIIGLCLAVVCILLSLRISQKA